MRALDVTTKEELLQWVLSNATRKDTCLLWSGAVNFRGYGVVSVPAKARHLVPKKQYLVHRLVFLLQNGSLTDYTLHHCDTPSCIEMDHLFEGTQLDNMTDMIAKDRNSKGEHHSTTGLKQRDVDFIRSWYTNGHAPYGTGRRLALYFGLSETTISEIATFSKWKE
jgi:hypothetical protein